MPGFGAFGELAFGESEGGGDLSPGGIASGEVFGTISLTISNINFNLTGIASGEVFGTIGLTFDGINFSPASIASGEAFGTASVRILETSMSIASAEAFGTAFVWSPVYYLPVSRAT